MYHINRSGNGYWFFAREEKYLASISFKCSGPHSAIDQDLAFQLARRIDIGAGLSNLQDAIAKSAAGAEVAIRVANTPLDTFLSIIEFADNSTILSAVAMLPFWPGGDKVRKAEAERLLGLWDVGYRNSQSIVDYVQDHAAKHMPRSGLDPGDVWKYLRKAENFNYSGATVKDYVDGRRKWTHKSGEFIIKIVATNKIVSYGIGSN